MSEDMISAVLSLLRNQSCPLAQDISPSWSGEGSDTSMVECEGEEGGEERVLRGDVMARAGLKGVVVEGEEEEAGEVQREIVCRDS
jgi:hypothetical protein